MDGNQLDIEDAVKAQSEGFLDGKVVLFKGDCLSVLASLPENSIDAVVCDPPYHLTSIVKRFGKTNVDGEGTNEKRAKAGADGMARLSRGFMGKTWDGGDIAFRAETWALVLRVLKPGGHLIAFSGTRTYHRMACAIEDAGFEVRDMIAWHYGSGFPKSHNVSKQIDKSAGAEREFLGFKPSDRPNRVGRQGGSLVGAETRATETAPATDAAKQWDGWGTALKPSHEPVCFAQKPLTNQQLFDTIGSDAARLWSRLWLMLSAKDAAKYLGLNPSVLGVETSAFAQWTAADASSTRAALSDQMGTSQFGSALISALSTVSSWNSTLAEASGHASTFITGTESSTTTELKILKSSLSRITPESIILAHKLGGWSNASASPAEKTFNAHVRKWQSTLELHALASVTEQFAEPSQVETATGSERVVLARKPLDGTVAENVMKWGVGALNIDACRVNTEDNLNGGAYVAVGGRDVSNSLHAGTGMNVAGKTTGKQFEQPVGRWPANLMHDGSPEVVAMFPAETGVSSGGKGEASQKSALAGHVYGEYSGATLGANAGGLGDSGSAARFFWSSKAAADDRLGSKHPTVKPLDLMRELTRLVTPPGGVVLDPFAGTGTTGEAAYLEGFRSVLIEMEVEYQADIARRMHLVTQPDRRAAVAKTKNNTEMPVEGLPLFGGDRTKAGA